MIRILTSFFFAFIVMSVHAEPLRLRRQSLDESSDAPVSPTPGTLPFSVPIPCPVRCHLKQLQAWAKVTSFEVPSRTMVENVDTLGKTDTLALMCNLYATHVNCFRGCNASNAAYTAAFEATPTNTEICVDNPAISDNTSSACLASNSVVLRQVCENRNAELLASSVRLSTQSQLDKDVTRQYCKDALLHAFCVLPAVRQRCGDIPYDAMRTIINATLIGVRVSVGDKAIRDLYPECENYLDYIDHGALFTFADRAIVNITTTTTLPAGATSTISYTASLDESTNTTSLVMRDDAGGHDSDADRMGGGVSPRFQTTPSDNGARRSFKNVMAVFAFSLLFLIFL